MQREFARNFDSLAGIFEFVGLFFEREGVDSSHRHAVDLAIEELFTNMVKYSPEGENDILIQLEKQQHHLEVRLTDFDVERFDPTQAPDVAIDAPLEKRRPGGLGLHLVKKLFDSMEYEYIDRQSRIFLKKNLEVA
jgi:anti-sigma regulatory factor (Ser/Thr protein kinase)